MGLREAIRDGWYALEMGLIEVAMGWWAGIKGLAWRTVANLWEVVRDWWAGFRG